MGKRGRQSKGRVAFQLESKAEQARIRQAMDHWQMPEIQMGREQRRDNARGAGLRRVDKRVRESWQR